MNKVFRTICNFKRGEPVSAAASELAKGSGGSSATADCASLTAAQTAHGFKLRQLAAFWITGLLGVNAWALPTGGVVVNGNASIATTGSVMTVQQAPGNATINWRQFNVGASESVNFKLANPNSITLNRVGGDSVVNGSVSSNGNLWFATGGNLFTIGSSGAISAMKEVFITAQDMAVGQYTKPTGVASSGGVNALPAGKLAAPLIHIDAGSVNLSGAELIAHCFEN
jgi:filamentous hemagglutinin family protein